MRRLLLFCVAFVATAAPAHAAGPGTLTSLECIGDTTTGPASCLKKHPAFGGSGPSVVNAGGTKVYATAYDDSAVHWFTRAADGTLTHEGCVEDPSVNNGCTDVPGLKNPWFLVLSPDGNQVYVAGGTSDAIVRLNVGGDGSLSDGGCVDDPGAPDVCGAGNSAEGLDGVYALAISPDGKSIYAGGNDHALVRLNRATDGTLTDGNCFADTDAGPGSCPVNTQGLNSVDYAVVSPDGKNVYTGNAEGVIREFDRAADGSLAAGSCVGDTEVGHGCATTAEGLDNAYGLAISPDGKNVYVASNGSAGGAMDGAITTLSRAADGALTWQRCVGDTGANDTCGSETPTLDQPVDVQISPDGTQVLASSAGDNAITVFNRDQDGVLTPASCVEDTEQGVGCDDAFKIQGLNGVYFTSFSPGGTNVYASGYSDSALVVLKRDLVPVCQDGSSSGANGIPQLITLTCSQDPNGDPTTLSIVDQPDHGTLGTIAGGAVNYMPDAGYSGPDAFDFKATAAGVDSNTAHVSITVAAANAAPALDTTDAPLVYTAGDPATPVDSGITVTDDSAQLVSAMVSVEGAFVAGQDVLAFTNQNGITGTYDAPTRALTLSGAASVADYQAALRSVTYMNTSASPMGTARTLNFSVNDGTLQGTGTRAISLIEQDEPDVPADTTKPKLSAFTVNPASFAAAGSGGSVAGKKKPKIGATVSYTLSEVAEVTFRVYKRKGGRVVGGECKKLTKKNRGKKKCDLLLKGGFAAPGKAGKNKFKFTGRLNNKKLPTGKYWLEVSYFDLAENIGKPVKAAFKIVKR